MAATDSVSNALAPLRMRWYDSPVPGWLHLAGDAFASLLPLSLRRQLAASRRRLLLAANGNELQLREDIDGQASLLGAVPLDDPQLLADLRARLDATAAGVPRWLLMVAASAVMLGCAVLVFWPGASLAVAYPAALTLTAVGGVIPSSILAAVPLVAPDAGLVGAVNGIVIHGSNIGTLLGPPLVAEVARLAGGWQLSPVVLGAAALTAIAGASALRARDAKTRQEVSAMVAGGSARLP
jgi:hypothetical protein